METEFLDLNGLSRLIHRSKKTILNDRVRNPAAVPPALRLPGTRHLLWHPRQVEEWLLKQAQPQPPIAAPPRSFKRRGRPRQPL